MGEPEELRGVASNWRRWNHGEGVGYDGKGCRMDGATSGARRDSKRVETDPLAIEQEGQHKRRKRTTSDVPRPSTPPPIHPRRPAEPVDPPRRRGRLKSRPRRVSQTRVHKCTYQVGRRLRGVSDVSDASHIHSRCWGSTPQRRRSRDTAPRTTGMEHLQRDNKIS